MQSYTDVNADAMGQCCNKPDRASAQAQGQVSAQRASNPHQRVDTARRSDYNRSTRGVAMKLSTNMRRLLLLLIFVVIAWQIWSRVHIIIFGSFGDLLILMAGLAVVFLVIDHYLNHDRE